MIKKRKTFEFTEIDNMIAVNNKEYSYKYIFKSLNYMQANIAGSILFRFLYF